MQVNVFGSLEPGAFLLAIVLFGEPFIFRWDYRITSYGRFKGREESFLFLNLLSWSLFDGS